MYGMMQRDDDTTIWYLKRILVNWYFSKLDYFLSYPYFTEFSEFWYLYINDEFNGKVVIWVIVFSMSFGQISVIR